MLKNLAFLLLFFCGLALVTLFEQEQKPSDIKGEKEEQNLTIGYCKTFERYAQSLAKENDLNLIEFSSSFDVISQLKSGDIDYAVIGRRAYGYEINEQILEIPLKEYGWTLISSEKNFLNYCELADFEIHTYLEQESVFDFFTFEPNIIFHEDINSALEGDLVLIHWEDFQDDFELVVPMEGENKVEKFRNPMLYTHETTKPLDTNLTETL